MPLTDLENTYSVVERYVDAWGLRTSEMYVSYLAVQLHLGSFVPRKADMRGVVLIASAHELEALTSTYDKHRAWEDVFDVGVCHLRPYKIHLDFQKRWVFYGLWKDVILRANMMYTYRC